jgi:hypothetical protein
MMEQYTGYWISGSAVPGPPNRRYWESLGIILKCGPHGSVIEVVRLQDTGIKFEVKELTEWYGLELSRIAMNEGLTSL